jgi:hypothetical protein
MILNRESIGSGYEIPDKPSLSEEPEKLGN